MNCLICGSRTEPADVAEATFDQCRCGFARLQAKGRGDGYWEGRENDAVNHTWADTQDKLFVRVLDELRRRQDNAVLYDVGGGIGYFTELAVARGFDAHNVELSAVACARAVDRLGSARVHQSLEGLPVADIITLWCVIGHTPDPAMFLEEVTASLRPGGWLFLTTPNWHFQRLLARLLAARGRTLNFERQDHISMFTRRSLTALLERHGFTDIHFGAWGVKERCVALGDSTSGAAVGAKRLWNNAWSRVGAHGPADLTSEFQVLARFAP